MSKQKFLRQHPSPDDLNPVLQALWHDANDDWDTAHQIVQAIDSWQASWVHAYLHRKEGDVANAAFWYRRAGEPMPESPLDREWEDLVRQLSK